MKVACQIPILAPLAIEYANLAPQFMGHSSKSGFHMSSTISAVQGENSQKICSMVVVDVGCI